MVGGRGKDNSGVAEKPEGGWAFPSEDESSLSVPLPQVPQMLFVGPGGWVQQTVEKQWRTNYGICMDLVLDYYLIPMQSLGQYRLVLFVVYPFIHARTGRCFTSEMLEDFRPLGHNAIPMREDGCELCAGLILQLRKANPALIIVALHAGDHDVDQLYFLAGADYVIQSGVHIFEDEFPRFLKGLLES